ncbi:LysR family transcriptional regulator [Azospirillum sp. A29]|jgi:DNA-binding transcriptional LysR family regulator|uniref:LysR family transcriptional regulator n=1 Tax=Azospirillum sp. A29 TaxID=3160606 RepID=UPI00366F22C5
MELRHLRHFLTVAKSHSLHSAARNLNLRQPTLSQSIRALEAHVGTLLIERRATGIRLTPAGKIFLNEITAILTALDRAIGSARLTAQVEGSLRLSIVSDFIPHQLAELLTTFQRHVPETFLLINDGSPTRLLSMLDAELLDLALLPATALPLTGSSIVLWEFPLHVALPASHPLCAEPMLKLHQLTEVPIILGNEQSNGSADQMLLSACHAAGLELAVAARVHEVELRFMLV